MTPQNQFKRTILARLDPAQPAIHISHLTHYARPDAFGPRSQIDHLQRRHMHKRQGTSARVVPAPQQVHAGDIRMPNHARKACRSAAATECWYRCRGHCRIVHMVVMEVVLGEALGREDWPTEF